MLTQNSEGLEELFFRFKLPIIITLIGLILIGAGILAMRFQNQGTRVEVLGTTAPSNQESATTGVLRGLIVEVSGEVVKPGVYSLPPDSRVEDALSAAGGLSQEANGDFVEKSINRAAKVVDGQKIYIPKQSDTTSATVAQTGVEDQSASPTTSETRVNINSASQSKLEELWGIGPVTAQSIIEQRPYSTINELLSKKIIKSNVYERIKNEISVY